MLGDSLLDAPIEDTLDLHGYTEEEARLALRQFLTAAKRRHPGAVVHVITGKGRGSRGAAVLRPAVARWLKGELKGYVRESALDLDDGGYLIRLG